jgi:drug/metabolite transporter (DMT)-like permease
VWFWLSLSGLVGFTLGDLCLFRAYVVIGSRLGTLFMLLSPPLTALAGWAMLGERLSLLDWTGMGITVLGVGLAASEGRADENGAQIKRPASGYWLALVAAACQAFGLILSKRGIGDYNPFAATQIRALAGFAGFAVLYVFIGWWPRVARSLRDRRAMSHVAVGSFFGPFLGVSLSLLAVQRTQAGVAATIMSIVPILIIPPAALLFRERVTWAAFAGALFAVGGVALLFA